jgi:hypothetical protein
MGFAQGWQWLIIAADEMKNEDCKRAGGRRRQSRFNYLSCWTHDRPIFRQRARKIQF